MTYAYCIILRLISKEVADQSYYTIFLPHTNDYDKRSSIAKNTPVIIITGSFPDLLLLGGVSEKFKIDYDDIVLLKKLYSFNLYN